MEQYIITINEEKIYINNNLLGFNSKFKLDEETKEIDLKKKALLAVALEMGFDAKEVFEEIANALGRINFVQNNKR